MLTSRNVFGQNLKFFTTVHLSMCNKCTKLRLLFPVVCSTFNEAQEVFNVPTQKKFNNCLFVVTTCTLKVCPICSTIQHKLLIGCSTFNSFSMA